MNIKTHIPILAGIALATSAHGQLINDGFESYTAGTELNTSGPWSTIFSQEGSLSVLDETTATPFGDPNQYLDFNDISDPGNPSLTVRSPNIAAASGVVTTFAFDFNEPTGGGAGTMIFGYSIENGDLNSSGRRLSMNLDDGAITGITADALDSNTYDLDASNRVYVVFNDTASAVSYNGGLNSVAAETADIWVQPIGEPLTLAGTRAAYNSQTASYKVAFRSFSTNVQRMFLDNVTLDTGIVLPDANPPTLAVQFPSDNDTGVSINPDLVATFDRRVIPGSGNITLKKTSDDSTVDTFDVTDPADVVFAGSSLTFSPSIALDLNTEYYLLIDSTAVESLTGVAFPEISVTTEWSFTTTTDATPPTILTKIPADDATGVAIDTNLVATFDELIAVGSGNIVITNVTESTTFATIDVSDVTQVSISGDTLTIDPAGDLLEGRDYAVELDSGSITDMASNPFAGISGLTTWNFETIPDVTDPTLVSTTPGNNTTRASIFNNLIANFDESIQAATGDVVIKNLTDATTFATYAIGDPEITIAGNQLTINFVGNLETDKDYAVQIDAGAITDFSGNSYAGIADDSTWNFMTTRLLSRDFILGERQAGAAPSDYYPDSSSNLVGTGGAGGSIDHRNVVLGMTLPTLLPGQTAGSVDFEFEITQARDTTGEANLPDLHVYLLDTADPDATGDGFFFEGASDPAADVELVTTTSVTLSGTGDNNFADDSEDRVVALTGDALTLIRSFYGGDHIPDQPEAFFRFNLDEDTLITTYRRYRIDVSSGESDIQVTGVSTSPPVLASSLPADDAPAVSESATLTATFDLPIQAGSGDITIKNITDATTHATIPVGDGQVTISGNDLIIDPTTDLDPEKDYAVQLAGGAVESIVGIAFAGVLDDTTRNFTTGTTTLAAQTSNDSIVGRSQSEGPALGYYTESGVRQVGAGGATNARTDRNVVLGFTLPTLPVGSTFGAANLNFEITNFRRSSTTSRALDVYLLDEANPNSTGSSLFYHGPSDPSAAAEFVGTTTLTAPNSTQITYADDEQDQSYQVTGDALALLQSFYGGDHIPERTEVFFRFNLDTLAPGTGDGGLVGVTFDRYFIDFGATESSLDVISTGGATSPYDTWASSFSPNPGLTTDNPDSDTLNNLLEFGFGTDPNAGDAVPLIADGSVNGTPIAVSSGGGGGITFDYVFVRRDDHDTSGSVSYVAEFSHDLVTFHASTVTPTLVADSTDDPDYEVVSIPYPAVLPEGKARFARMRVELVP